MWCKPFILTIWIVILKHIKFTKTKPTKNKTKNKKNLNWQLLNLHSYKHMLHPFFASKSWCTRNQYHARHDDNEFRPSEAHII